jgi:hypothetical protein
MSDAALRALETLPGVGPSIARDLVDLGVRRPDDLVGRDADLLYESLCRLRGVRIDPCVKYVFRCAVHCASDPDADPALRRWWAWKDGGMPQTPGGGRG